MGMSINATKLTRRSEKVGGFTLHKHCHHTVCPKLKSHLYPSVMPSRSEVAQSKKRPSPFDEARWFAGAYFYSSRSITLKISPSSCPQRNSKSKNVFLLQCAFLLVRFFKNNGWVNIGHRTNILKLVVFFDLASLGHLFIHIHFQMLYNNV